MNKNAIKKFAIAARTRLIATVSDKAGTLGITKEGISEPLSKGNGFEIYKTSAGTEVMLQGSQMEQRRRLIAQVKARGFDVVMEEVAYTWFNRICAIRFMEVNDYLPMRIRVLSSLKEGKNEPDLLTEAPNVELDFSDKEREWIINAKAENRLDELFSMLFIKQCNKLSEVLPELFEATEDYTEMLLNLSYTNKDDVIRMLVDGVDEKDFNVTTPDENGRPTGQVEIIGWLYQYYNTELKDDTFAQLKKNVKISKERIPAATQLFTPDWIVRYMVENSVGRIWIEHLRAINPETNEKTTAENFGWKYYLPEAEQEPEVNSKLAEIRKSYADIKPEDILCIDPCMGSGHIIVAMFDVLMDIYKSVGYGEREAAFEIVEHNLHGLDIDKRAYQLAYFAVMMKGRQYNRRFFRGKEEGHRPRPRVFAFVESNDVNRAQLKYFGAGLNEIEKNNAITQMNGLLDTFKDAREYGSIINVDSYDWDLLCRYTALTDDEGQMTLDAVGLPRTQDIMKEIIRIGELMSKKYDSVVTNPPYMGSSGMSGSLAEYIKMFYPESKADLFSVFICKATILMKKNGNTAMITPQSLMFINGFEYHRSMLLSNNIVTTMAYMGFGAFGTDFGTTAFSFSNIRMERYKGTYKKLDTVRDIDAKENLFLYNPSSEYNSVLSEVKVIPGEPLAFWVRDISIFRRAKLGEKLFSGGRIKTHNNNKYVREWWEIKDKSHWVPYANGGGNRKWYGNFYDVVDWSEEAIGFYVSHGGLINSQYIGKEGITWNDFTSKSPSYRIKTADSLYSSVSPTVFNSDFNCDYRVLGLLNSKVGLWISELTNPTVHTLVGDVLNYPDYTDECDDDVSKLVISCVALSKEDWDAFEISWDFIRHPMLPPNKELNDSKGTERYLISDIYKEWEKECEKRFQQLKNNEEKINRIFIDIYDLQEELTPTVNENDITIRKADLRRDIHSLISYVVGCMFGRYSHLLPGIIYAGGEWPPEEKAMGIREQYFPETDLSIFSWMDAYGKYAPDLDNIIPITDEEFFSDDIVARFIEFIKVIYGSDTLEENLDFIAKNLGNKGDSARDVIRNYFLNDFFKDHCNTYSVAGSGKRPIYWLFDSGKQNGFKALIYLHRYDRDTVGRVRTDYLHKTQRAIEQAMQSAQYTLDNSNNGTEKSRATKRISKYTKQLAEIQLYDEAIAHVANQRIPLDLDDGVKANYEKFQGVEVSREGMKTVKIDLLAPIKYSKRQNNFRIAH